LDYGKHLHDAESPVKLRPGLGGLIDILILDLTITCISRDQKGNLIIHSGPNNLNIPKIPII
jgi:hypothetical protein